MNILFVISPSEFRDQEYFVPKKIFEDSGVETQTASTIVGDLEGADGSEASATIHINEVNPDEFDGVVFVGGPGMTELVDDVEMVKLAKTFFEAGKPTTAICIAPAILANAGVVGDKKITAWAGVENNITKAGGIFTGKKVEQDGTIITADGPSSAKLFADKIVEYFQNKPKI